MAKPLVRVDADGLFWAVLKNSFWPDIGVPRTETGPWKRLDDLLCDWQAYKDPAAVIKETTL